jgi:hypothetical protein
MKKRVAVHVKTVVLGLGAALFLGAASPLAGEDDVLAKLNVAPAAAKAGILEALASGTVYNEAACKVFKTLPGLAREKVVRAGLAWIKAYVASAEFKEAYDKMRGQEKPEPPAVRPSAGDELKKMKLEMEKSIAEMKKNMAAMDAEMRKTMEGVIQEMRAQMGRMENDPQQRESMRQATAMTAEEDRKRHEEALKEWEQRYPADLRALIRRRSNEFLVLSAGVDFTAQLAPRGDKMIFAREDYERKPSEWTLCFRAGKEATAAARAFAENWLKELGKN